MQRGVASADAGAQRLVDSVGFQTGNDVILVLHPARHGLVPSAEILAVTGAEAGLIGLSPNHRGRTEDVGAHLVGDGALRLAGERRSLAERIYLGVLSQLHDTVTAVLADGFGVEPAARVADSKQDLAWNAELLAGIGDVVGQDGRAERGTDRIAG